MVIYRFNSAAKTRHAACRIESMGKLNEATASAVRFERGRVAVTVRLPVEGKDASHWYDVDLNSDDVVALKALLANVK